MILLKDKITWKKVHLPIRGSNPRHQMIRFFVFNVESRGSVGKRKWPPKWTTVYGVSNIFMQCLESIIKLSSEQKESAILFQFGQIFFSAPSYRSMLSWISSKIHIELPGPVKLQLCSNLLQPFSTDIRQY